MIRPLDEFESSGIDPFVDAYEAAQESDGGARLSDFLPAPDHPLYLAALCELIRVDLEYGWTRGTPRDLEDYRSEFPALFREPELLRQVAFEDWRLRRQAGQDVAPEEYRRRYGVEVLDASSDPLGSSPISLDDPVSASRLADALARLPEPGSDFAGFRLVRELGRGAFGRVYLARQAGLADRPVALKVSVELEGETRALARLQHAHVVPIYSSHRAGPLRAVCMPYLGATTLADLLRDLRARGAPFDSGAAILEAASSSSRRGFEGAGDDRPTAVAPARRPALGRLGPVPAVLWIGARLAEGLAHAHERGIIHRDLKPANVLLTDDGQPMLLDFNLASDTRSGTATTRALVGGTLPYMAPEQLEAMRGRPGAADPRGDLYALGLILHELLTGRHPFPIHRGPFDEVVERMLADRLGPPPKARDVNPAVTPAVESILRRCLEPDPSRRYQSAAELVDDLQRQLDDRPLRFARDSSPRERLAKWSRRHPRLSSSTTLGAAAAVLLAATLGMALERERRSRPAEAAHALRRLGEAHEAALALLFDPSADAARCAEGVATCRLALEPYGDVGSPSWYQSRLVRALPDDDRATLRARLGEVLLFWARGLARQAAARGPSSRGALVREALLRNGLAEACFAPGPAPRVLWVQRAALARLSGDEAAAKAAESRAAEVPVRSPRELALLVLEDPEGRSTREAWPALARAGRRDPKDFPLWMLLGQLHARQGRLDEADDCFTGALLLRPDSPWVYYHRGLVALERREHDEARHDFDRVVQLRPGLAAARVNRAVARLGLRDHGGAIADLTDALALGADESRLYLIRGRARLLAGDRDGAARDRAEGIRRTPGDVPGWVARGLARLPDDPRGALADLEAALVIDPWARPALQGKAVVLSEHLGRPEEAIPVLDRVVRLYPDYVPGRIGRGVVLARLGRRGDAHRDAEAARRRDASADTTYRAACIYALTSRAEPTDRAVAVALLSQALAGGPEWAEVARNDPDLEPLRNQPEFQAALRGAADRTRPAASRDL